MTQQIFRFNQIISAPGLNIDNLVVNNLSVGNLSLSGNTIDAVDGDLNLNSAAGNVVIKNGNTTLLTIFSTGNIRGTALHNNPAAFGGAGEGELRSGTYTPTLFNTTNVTSSTPSIVQWLRVGNVVTISGTVAVNTTAGGDASTLLGISLPAVNPFNGVNELSGTAVATNTAGINARPGQLSADTTNGRASLTFNSAAAALHNYYFQFTYVVNGIE